MTVTSSQPQAQVRPLPPARNKPAYLGLLLLAVAAFAYFWVNRTSSQVLFLPLGGTTLWVPQYPLFGFILMLVVLALCWRIRAGGMAAFGALGAVIFTYWAGSTVNFTLTPLIDSWDQVQPQLEGFLSPNWGYIFSVWDQWLITLCMAIVATFSGCLVGLLLALLASPVSSPNRFVSQLVKTLNSVVRSIPDVGWALLFVALIGGTAFGLGPLAGVLALFMFNVGIVAKLVSESIDAVNPGSVEAVDAVGATLVQRNRLAVMPQVTPAFVSYSLYVLELNIRASAALGIVGVGGIGQVIMLQLNRFQFSNVAAIVVALVVVVLLVDALSVWTRRRLL